MSAIFSHSLSVIQTSYSRVVEAFYNEKKDYDPNNPLNVAATGHFTQLVWKSTTKLGVGGNRYKDGTQTCFIVILYIGKTFKFLKKLPKLNAKII